MHEASQHSRNVAITLTYDNAHLPPAGGLRYEDFQKFLKRSRRKLGRFSFYACGEYGQNLRGHYHCVLFGADFDDRYQSGVSDAGFDMFRSKELESLWPFGNSTLGDVTFQTCSYIARYIFDKVSGDPALEHYSRVDKRTGEIVDVSPEFNRMSLKPAIGFRWFEKYWRDVYLHDRLVYDGKVMRPPRTYDVWLRRIAPAYFRHLKERRAAALKDDPNYLLEARPKRLEAKRQVIEARLSFKKRGLK